MSAAYFQVHLRLDFSSKQTILTLIRLLQRKPAGMDTHIFSSRHYESVIEMFCTTPCIDGKLAVETVLTIHISPIVHLWEHACLTHINLVSFL